MSQPRERKIGDLPLSPLEEYQRGKNYFFGIGINTYQNFQPLNNARKDVEDVKNLLISDYYFEDQSCKYLFDEEATRENIIDEINDLRSKVNSNDRLLIYFSGHGFKDENRGFWIPVDARKDRLGTYISNAEVRDIINAIKARHILLISDSCFSASLLVRDATRDIGGAFIDWERNASRHVFISGKGVVSDGEKGKNSPFAFGIIKHLVQNKAEALNIVSLANSVTQEVRFNYEQQAELSPLQGAGHEGGQFIFVKKQTERDDWHRAVTLNTEVAFLTYLDKYPEGVHNDEAEKKLFDIADDAAWRNAEHIDAAFAYRQYLQKFNRGKYVEQARAKLSDYKNNEETERLRLIEEKLWSECKTNKTPNLYLSKFPNGRFKDEAMQLNHDFENAQKAIDQEKKRETERLRFLEEKKLHEQTIENSFWLECKKANTPNLYLQRYPKGEYIIDARRLEIQLRKPVETKTEEVLEPVVVAPVRNNLRLFIIGGGAIVLVFIVWQILKTSDTNPIIQQSQTVTQTAPTTNEVAAYTPPTISEPAKTKKPKMDNGSDDPVETEKPKKQVVETKSVPADDSRTRQIEADKKSARNYLQTALASIKANENSDAKDALNSAKNIGSLSNGTKNYIKTALANINANENKDAIDAINNAIYLIN